MKNVASLTAEGIRLSEDRARTNNWKRRGPYLSERQWATVCEDYSPYATAGITSPMDMLAAGHTAGVKMDYSDSLIASAGFVLRSHSGMDAIRS
jgi:hypothetical protein